MKNHPVTGTRAVGVLARRAVTALESIAASLEVLAAKRPQEPVPSEPVPAKHPWQERYERMHPAAVSPEEDRP